MQYHLLVTGGSGQLGRRVVRQALAQGWQVTATYHSASPSTLDVDWRFLNLADLASIAPFVQTLAPDAIVHTAALGQMTSDAWRINADGSAAIAAASAQIGARLIHMSSDAVFAGRTMPYTEDDDPFPVTPYSASKAAAETAVRALAPSAALVRTSLIIDDEPIDKHSQMVFDIADGRRAEALFTDEIRCPVAAIDLATAVVELITLPYAGIIHIAGADPISRYELGILVARRYQIDPARLRTATIAESGLQRPANLRLDSSRARHLLATPLRGAHDFLVPTTYLPNPSPDPGV